MKFVLVTVLVIQFLNGTFGDQIEDGIRSSCTIAREQLGVVFKPGRFLSVAETNHVSLTFMLQVPKVRKSNANVTANCFNRSAHVFRENAVLKTKYDVICGRLVDFENWANGIIHELVKTADKEKKVIKQISGLLKLEARRNDRQGNRTKRAGLPVLNVVGEIGYHLFGIARADDVALNREYISILKNHTLQLSVDLEQVVSAVDKNFRDVEHYLGVLERVLADQQIGRASGRERV